MNSLDGSQGHYTEQKSDLQRCDSSCTTFSKSDGEQIHGVQEGWPWRDSLYANRTILHPTRWWSHEGVSWNVTELYTHTHKHTKDSTKKSETQTRSVLSIVVPRAVSWVSRSIVTMEDPSLDEAAMVSGELSTLFLQLLVSLSDFKVKSLKIADIIRTSLVVQWLTLHAASAGTWVHSPVRSQLRVSTLQVKIPQAAVKTQHRQINN